MSKYINFTTPDKNELEETAVRIRKHIATMFHVSINGHYGGCMSCTELLTALYFSVINVNPQNPKWEERDRFVISKGHCAATLYGALAERGFFPTEWFYEYEKLGAKLNTHPCMHTVPGLDISSGSLGHGLSAGVGMAIGAKMNKKSYRTFVLLGDGECSEGSVWEAAMSASKYKLDNLIAIVDRNQLCVGGCTEEIMPLEPFTNKWEAFGWSVYLTDGHDFDQILSAFDSALSAQDNKPKVIIANTIKGKGVSFMENRREWHAKHINDETHESIMKELEGMQKCKV